LRRPSLRSQLNQIRLWVRQGRTDAWIAHKLDISVEQLEQFKREHQLDGDAPPSPAPLSVDTAPFEADEDPLQDLEDARPAQQEPDEEDADDEEQGDPEEAQASRRRRRGRRGGRRRKRTPAYEATFEHGDEGYGLWLDPAVADDGVYADNWAGHREVTVTVEADVITIRRAGSEPD
jgi:hypothetical protein